MYPIDLQIIHDTKAAKLKIISIKIFTYIKRNISYPYFLCIQLHIKVWQNFTLTGAPLNFHRYS